MKRHLSLFALWRLVCVLTLVCVLLSCGLTAFAAEESSPLVITITGGNDESVIVSGGTSCELYPADVQTVIEDGKRQIVKTYTLTAGENPDNIPRESFERDGWIYTLTDITQERTSGADVKDHTETVELETDSNDLNEILTLLSPTLEYESGDGYCGLLTLDLASVKCEAAGYTNGSYTVTATREYPNLPANDLYYIPKTITDNGRTLALDSVEWEAQSTVNMGYTDIPDSYRAVAKYTGKASQTAVTGYVTTADYTGEVTREIAGDTVYTAYFTGAESNPAPQETEPTPKPAPDTEGGSIPIVPLVGVAVIVALLGGAAAFFFLRHNVKVYSVGEDGFRVLIAKVRISAKNPAIDLTPLDGRAESRCFSLEIDKLAAKGLNDSTVEVIYGSAKLPHKIAYEGNLYRIEANFHDMTIKAIY